MPFPDFPDLSDWTAVGRTFLRALEEAEPVLRQLLPYLPVLLAAALLLYLLVLAAREVRDWWSLRQRTRLSRLMAKIQRIKERIADKGRDKRLRLASSRQRRNLKELAVLVEEQLEAAKSHMHPQVYKRTSVLIERSVTNLDFDRLYCLHHLLSQADAKQITPRLETFFQRAR